MTTPVSTRERLVSEAMRLFSAKGFEATSVSQIEAAAGLAAGSGALYRHFKSKDALLNAGIDRQLDRRHAMRDIRALFAGLGDLHAELTALGRYLLSVIDEEAQLLQIAARTPAGRSARLDTAYAALIDGLNVELADWITAWAPHLAPGQCKVLAALGINGILGTRVATNLFHQPEARSIPDDQYISEWTAVLTARIQSLQRDDAT
ncbi:TetR/AcrR family transcriptional regulator [Mycobacterium timonense]|uniref:TetR family transcriptional regulator n=2 Tax=Mycobacterium avium complex (MAC) TaxID=120793 RepID=A0AAW5S7V9_MYCBC|nr:MULTISPECIES: TetR/AcrR family transcriptional regulator [Mycobacterium avium complex (MAC)]MCV6990757.1 TetR/AcrR family transcriptional regulator [Mycobacterium bouchedurhonense]MCV6997303.1 TetR/AcrR family transcriptional regulator [Mycobacterium timonense]ORA42320.1 TetR family transcriptional regulator [Mycobacterium bouchedurhonense]ORB76693.1 TetR family transcriptional regulator [Mycobacterium timonense]